MISAFVVLVVFAAASALDLRSVYSAEELSNMDSNILEDASFNFTQLVTKYGYPVEEYRVETKDGYELTLQRIPYGRKCGPGEKIPVFLQHGLFCSSVDYIVMGPSSAFGYMLADECFDVWFGNSRGNRYSRSHVKFHPGDPKFWEFSWHEMGSGDLPTVIDFILAKTGQPSLHYVGHSQGTTQFFTFASEHKEYHKKIRSAHALAPVAYMKNLKSPIVKALAIFQQPLAILAELVGLHEFLPLSTFLNMIGMQTCQEQFPLLQAVCSNVIFLLTGFNPSQLNTTMLPVIIGHTPAGASTRQLLHYAQEISQDGFRRFDHGFLGNIIMYGSPIPPSYNIQDIQIPTALYYSNNDWLSDPVDVDRLAELLPNVIGKYKIGLKEFNHIDFIWGIDAKRYLYDKVISLIKRY